MDRTQVAGDAGSVLAVLAWAIEHEVELTTVSVGPTGCSVTLARAVAPRDQNAPPVDPRASMYRQFGGKVFDKAVDDGAIDEHGNIPAVR